MDFNLASPTEVCLELGGRLKAARQTRSIQQAELASRAGISRNTLLALESHGQGSLATLVRVASALGIVDQLQSLFITRIDSIAQLEARAAPLPKRIRKPARKTSP